MAVIKIFSRPVYNNHHASVCSKAFFIRLFAILITFIAPLLIAYASGGFWQREATYREQPDVHFKHELLAVVETSNTGDYVTWSTYSNYNQLQMDNLRVMLVKSREEDTDLDGLNDLLHLQVDVPLLDTEIVLGVQLMLIFDYKLYKFSQFSMESMAYVQHQSPVSGAGLTVTGDLTLYQNDLLGHKGVDARYQTPVVQNTSVYAEAFDLSTIFGSYILRNVSTQYSNQYPVWNLQRATGKPFIIKATVNYPEQHVYYEPGFWQMLKWGFVQYIAIFIPFAYFIEKFLEYFYREQLVSTRVKYAWEKKHA